MRYLPLWPTTHPSGRYAARRYLDLADADDPVKLLRSLQPYACDHHFTHAGDAIIRGLAIAGRGPRYRRCARCGAGAVTLIIPDPGEHPGTRRQCGARTFIQTGSCGQLRRYPHDSAWSCICARRCALRKCGYACVPFGTMRTTPAGKPRLLRPGTTRTVHFTVGVACTSANGMAKCTKRRTCFLSFIA